MNKARRKAIAEARGELEFINNQLETVKATIEDLMNEEQEYYDNMHENLQGGTKGEQAEAAISAMQSALDSILYLGDAISSLEEAAE